MELPRQRTGRPAPPRGGRAWRFGPGDGTRAFDLPSRPGRTRSLRAPRAGRPPGEHEQLARARWPTERSPGLARFAGAAGRRWSTTSGCSACRARTASTRSGSLPRMDALATSMPGLMLVSENLLARLADPDDDFAAMISAHEVAHLSFGGLVGSRWWDDLWLDEAMATYVSDWPEAAAIHPGPPSATTRSPGPSAADELPSGSRSRRRSRRWRRAVPAERDQLREGHRRRPAAGRADRRRGAAGRLADYLRRFGGGCAPRRPDRLLVAGVGRDLAAGRTTGCAPTAHPRRARSDRAGRRDRRADRHAGRAADAPTRRRAVRRSRPGAVLPAPGTAPRSAGRGQPTGAAGRAGPGRTGPNDGDWTYARSRSPGHLGGAGRGGHQRRRPADRGRVLERGLADGDGGCVGRRARRRIPAW